MTRTFSRPTRLVFLFGFAIVMVLLTRLPLSPAHLHSFDAINLAFSLKDFDPIRSQPQLPGYPLFVVEARLLSYLFGTADRTFAIQACLISGITLGMLFLLGRRMLSVKAGLCSAALLFVNPVFWFAGLTSPLRLHLALISVLVAYFCWRALPGEAKYFYAAAVALGLGGGFRPELLLLLLPLWVWTGWQCRDGSVRWLRGLFLLGASSLIWVFVLVIACGGPVRMIAGISAYLFSQADATSVLLNPSSGTWLRWVGRALLWNGLGVLPWIWTIPLGCFRRHDLGEAKQRLVFLALWFLPAFAFHLFIHVGDPDHTLATIPVLCLAGAYCVIAAEETLARWIPELREAGLLVTWIVLGGSLALFFGRYSLPRRDAASGFGGLRSVSDAILIGNYETSYRHVTDVAVQTDAALAAIQRLTSNTDRPVLLLWSMYAEPMWRKVCFYFPSAKIYALYEDIGPGASGTRAQLWSGSTLLASHQGTPPFRVVVPKGARLIWLLNPASVAGLSSVVSLQEAHPVHYTDLPVNASSFRWGSFDLVPE